MPSITFKVHYLTSTSWHSYSFLGCTKPLANHLQVDSPQQKKGTFQGPLLPGIPHAQGLVLMGYKGAAFHINSEKYPRNTPEFIFIKAGVLCAALADFALTPSTWLASNAESTCLWLLNAGVLYRNYIDVQSAWLCPTLLDYKCCFWVQSFMEVVTTAWKPSDERQPEGKEETDKQKEKCYNLSSI